MFVYENYVIKKIPFSFFLQMHEFIRICCDIL